MGSRTRSLRCRLQIFESEPIEQPRLPSLAQQAMVDRLCREALLSLGFDPPYEAAFDAASGAVEPA